LTGLRQPLEYGWRPCIKARFIPLTLWPSNSIAARCGNATYIPSPIMQLLPIAHGGSAPTIQVVRLISDATVAGIPARSLPVACRLIAEQPKSNGGKCSSAGAVLSEDGKCTMTKSKMALSAALILFTTFAAAAAAKKDTLPTLDLQTLCRARAQSTADMSLTTGNPFDMCMKSEQEARAALVAAWNDIPPFYRATCIRPNVFSPSYVEWIACLETNIDVKSLGSNR
jgi:hypothetical protein